MSARCPLRESPAARRTLRPCIRWSGLIAITALLTACITSSPPTTYIQLSAGDVEPGVTVSPQVIVENIRLPDYLLRNSLLRRIDGNQLRYDGLYRWAEPLDIGAQRVLVQRLSAELDSSRVTGYPRLPGSGDIWHVTVNLRHFEAVDTEAGARAEMLADVRILPPQAAASPASLSTETQTPAAEPDALALRFEASEALADRSGGTVAAVLSELLAALARDIADVLEDAGDGAVEVSVENALEHVVEKAAVSG